MTAVRTYAIGDIHGSLEKLRSLLALCERDADGAAMRFAFVGDYIDRGPDSRGVIECLMALQTQHDVVALMGNHEAMALAAIENSLDVGTWLREGGDATLRSFGVANPYQLPRAHVDWLSS